MGTRPRLYVLLYSSNWHRLGLGYLALPLGPSRGNKRLSGTSLYKVTLYRARKVNSMDKNCSVSVSQSTKG